MNVAFTARRVGFASVRRFGTRFGVGWRQNGTEAFGLMTRESAAHALPLGAPRSEPMVCGRPKASLLACGLDKTGSEARLRVDGPSQRRSFLHPDRRRGDTSFGGRHNVGVWNEPAL